MKKPVTIPGEESLCQISNCDSSGGITFTYEGHNFFSSTSQSGLALTHEIPLYMLQGNIWPQEKLEAMGFPSKIAFSDIKTLAHGFAAVYKLCFIQQLTDLNEEEKPVIEGIKARYQDTIMQMLETFDLRSQYENRFEDLLSLPTTIDKEHSTN